MTSETCLTFGETSSAHETHWLTWASSNELVPDSYAPGFNLEMKLAIAEFSEMKEPSSVSM